MDNTMRLPFCYNYCITVPSAKSDSVAIEDDGAVIYKTCERAFAGQRPHAARSDRHDGVILCRRGAKDRKIFSCCFQKE